MIESVNLPLHWRAFRLPKRGCTLDECEDAWATDPATGRFAVADGVTECAFAGLWSRLLVEGFVAATQRPDVWNWLDGPRRRWSSEVMGLELPWYAEMKRKEGAYATMLGLNVRAPTSDRPGLWQSAAVGDSCVMRVRKGRYVRSFPVKSSSDFGNVPGLIGSWDNTPPTAAYTSGSLLPGDRLFLMTDALAQWFLNAHERGGRPWEAIASALSAEQPEEAITKWVEKLRDDDGLRDDDVALLVIEVGSALEE